MKIFERLNLLHNPESFGNKEEVDAKADKSNDITEKFGDDIDSQMEDRAPSKEEFNLFTGEMKNTRAEEIKEQKDSLEEFKKPLSGMMEAILAQSGMSRKEFEAQNKFA